MTKILICSLLVCLFVFSATAEWNSTKSERDLFDPYTVYATSHAVKATFKGLASDEISAKCNLQFHATETVSAVGLSVYCAAWGRSYHSCFRIVTAKARVDGKLTPVQVSPGYINIGDSDYSSVEAHIDSADKWYDLLSSADHLLLRIKGGEYCSNFDMEFDVSGIPNLSPVFP